MTRPAAGTLLVALIACGDGADEPESPDAASAAIVSDAAPAGSDAASPDGVARGDGGRPPGRDASTVPMDAGGNAAVDAAGADDAGGNPDDDAGDVPQPVARFVDVTQTAGLGYVQGPPHDYDWTSDDWYDLAGVTGDSAYMTGGAAAGDYDGDGHVDLYVTRVHEPGILFRNRGDGTFEDVTAAAGLSLAGFKTVGAGWGDVDNDGDPDLYVTTMRSDRFLFFLNDGDGTFTEDAIARGVALQDGETHLGQSVTFGDYDRDGWLDLVTTEWQRDLGDPPPPPSHSRLFHNRGGEGPAFAGHFTDVTTSAGVDFYHVTKGALTFASSLTDLDDDGWPDLAVASDFRTSRLFWNDGDGTFTLDTIAAGVGTDQFGMGSAIGDYDGDGRLDWFVTSIHCLDVWDTCTFNGNRLYRNNGDRTFSDQTDAAGVRAASWAWGTTFFEIDNDGDLDLVATNGSRLPQQGMGPYYFDPTQLWQNDGTGVMTEASKDYELVDHGDGKGLLVWDYDADGDEDVYIVDHVAGGRLWQNRVADVRGNGWLRLRLEGVTANRSAYGARVRVERHPGGPIVVRELLGGSNFLGNNEPLVHIGLGPGTDPVHRIEVTWPTPGARKQQVLDLVAPNQVLDLKEPD